LVSGDAFSFHEDALGLTDKFARSQRLVEVGEALLARNSFLGSVEGDAGEGGEDEALCSVGRAERRRHPGIEFSALIGWSDMRNAKALRIPAWA